MRLARTVVVDGRAYLAGSDDVPDHVAAQVTNPRAWEGDQAPHTVPVESPVSEESPDPGTDTQTEVLRRPAGNASQEAWYEFRAAQGVLPERLDDMTRNELRDMEH